MTEAIEQPQASKPLEVRSALRRAILVPVICILTGLGLFGFYFWQLAFWQFAASAAGLATALILVVSGYLLANKKWPTLGGWLILTGMLLPFAVFESFYRRQPDNPGWYQPRSPAGEMVWLVVAASFYKFYLVCKYLLAN